MFRLPTAKFLLLCSAFSGNVALAAEASRPVVTPLATLGKLAIALLFVLVVFWVFAKVTRQFQGTRGAIHSGLSIVGTLALGQRERVVIVQVGDEQLVLGVTSSHVSTLHVLPRPLTRPSDDEHGDFRQKLSAAIKRQVAS